MLILDQKGTNQGNNSIEPNFVLIQKAIYNNQCNTYKNFKFKLGYL